MSEHCVLKDQCPRGIWAYCLMCNELKKGKQMIEVNKGDRIAVEMIVTCRHNGVISATCNTGTLPILIPQSNIREVIEHAAPGPGDILVWGGEQHHGRLVAIDKDTGVMFLTIVKNEGLGWVPWSCHNGRITNATIDRDMVWRIIERAKS